MKEKMQNRLLKLSYALKRNTTLNNKANTIAFLHIGKNAGTQITHVTKQLKKYNIKIKKYHHKTKLADLSRNSQYFFSIRNPATRFLSGFYSRKRKGQPRLNIDWNIHEKIAFEQFEHANDIAENLIRIINDKQEQDKLTKKLASEVLGTEKEIYKLYGLIEN